MIDDFIEALKTRDPAGHTARIEQLTSKSLVVFDVSEVWSALPETNWQSRVRPLLDSTPIRPPYPDAWWEWRSNTASVDDALRPGWSGRVPQVRTGCLSFDFPPAGARAFLRLYEASEAHIDSVLREARSLGVVRFICANLFQQIDKRIVMFAAVAVGYDENGMIPSYPAPPIDGATEGDTYFVIGVSMLPEDAFTTIGGVPFGASDMLTNTAWQVAYFNALLHVRNTVALPHSHPERLQRSRQRHGREPFRDFHTLHVVTPRQARDFAAGKPLTLDRSMPAHTVHGHYVRYSAERPMLGKPWGVGTFWVPAHTRGSKAVGQADKDYKLMPAAPLEDSDAQ
jgi:hypothetical protein